jgi:hypothetical protein
MKKLSLFLLVCLATITGYSQRFLTPQFEAVTEVLDIQYGFNFNYKGDSTLLYMDLYTPLGDTMAKRPVVVLAHGGSFVQGNKRSTEMIAICTALAKRGYVVASIQYRIGINVGGGNTLEKEFLQAAWRGAQDGRAAIRFLRKHIADGNAWRIDNEQFYSGGVSAGGVLALQAECLDLTSELAPLNLDTNTIGGIEGNSGNPGYNWRVKGVVSLCGAMGNVNWISNNTNISICNMHGDLDKTVPYKSDYFKFFNSPVVFLQGSFSVDSAAKVKGMNSRLYTFNGSDHVPFVGATASNLAYMDTVINYVSAYLYRFVSGIIPIALDEKVGNTLKINVYPNPAIDFITITNARIGSNLKLTNLAGQVLLNRKVDGLDTKLSIAALPSGIYFISAEEENVPYFVDKIVVE